MSKVLISIPDSLINRLRAAIPARQRSKIIANLLTKEIEERERKLYACAVEVEKDKRLSEELDEWDITIGD